MWEKKKSEIMGGAVDGRREGVFEGGLRRGASGGGGSRLKGG